MSYNQQHPQGTNQGSMPNQQQNSGQPRGQYPAQNAGKQPGPQGSPGQHTSSQPLPDPQYSLWTIEKPLNAESWDVADPEQQYVSAEDVQERLVRFRRQGEDIPGILLQLKSQSARRAVNKLVKVENNRLWQHNPTIQYAIASIKVEKDVMKHWPDKGKKRLRRIDIILQTERRPTADIPKAYLDTKANKMGQDSSGAAGQGAAQNQKGSNPQGPGGGQGQNGNMQQQQQNRPQQQGQFQGQGQAHGQQQHGQGYGQQPGHYGQQPGQAQGRPQGPNDPPPPPPPPGGHGGGPGGIPPPPPPPPTRMQPQVVHSQQNQPQVVRPQQMPQQQAYQMPGAYPGMSGPSRMPPVEVLDPRVVAAQKARPRGHRHDLGDESESDYSDSDLGSLGSRSVEDGYGYVERSGSRGRKHHDRRNRSRSQRRHRSRSRGDISKPYKDARIHGHIDYPPRDRFDGARVSPSPHPPNGGLPSQNIINIRVDNDNERANAKKSKEAHNRARDPRRASHSISPTGFPSPKLRKQDKYTAEPMYRGGSNNGSDSETSWAGSSSIYSGTNSSVFSEPDRGHVKRPPMPRPRGDSFDYDRRAKANYTGPNDYPPQRPRARSPFHDDYINPPVRRHSKHQNPFTPHHTGYAPHRPDPYIGPDRLYSPPQRYITEKEHYGLDMADLADAVYEEVQRRQVKGGRRGSGRVPGSLARDDTDEWATPNRADRYERVHPGYSGYRHV